MRPSVADNADSMCRRITSSKGTISFADTGRADGGSTILPATVAAGRVGTPSDLAISNCLPSPRIAPRSITVASSRTLPGQEYDINNSISASRLGRVKSEPRGRTPGKMPRQFGNVLETLAERWNDDGEHGQAIPQVLAELARGYHVRQVAMGGGHDPHVDADRPLPADTVEPAVLQDPQQADLGGQGQFGQFIQQERAAVGPFEPALPRLGGAVSAPFS